jgi:hypothetical protein
MKKMIANLSASFRNWRRRGETNDGVRTIPDPLEQFIVMRHVPRPAGSGSPALPFSTNLLPR